jgi:DAK2 domain fusion protein YloV
LNYLDGKRLRQAVRAGSNWLASNRDFLNAINVFPVADGDTGTNMALTLQAAVAGADAAKSNNLQDVADSIALHSLRGARGNSGVIMSQYFKGIAEFVERKHKLSVDDVAAVFRAGANSAYSAISDPKEGTILTVITDIADHLHSTKGKIKNIPHLLEIAIKKGKISLNETTEKLKVLKDAGVVDAGAQGFVHFIEGISDFIKTGKIAKAPDIAMNIEQVPDVVEEHSKFRYCSEFLVKSDSFNSDEIKQKLSGDGDSLIVAVTSLAGQSYLRIHIHTDEPENVKQYASSLGMLENTKIDDMKAQNKSMRKWRFNLKKTSKKTIRIVTD